MTPTTKNLLKTLAAFGGTAIVFTLLCAFGGYYAVKAARENKVDTENTVTPVADDSVDGTIETLHDYGKAVDEHVQVCDELLATAKAADQVANACMDQLRQCMGMLEANYLIPKRTAEKEK